MFTVPELSRAGVQGAFIEVVWEDVQDDVADVLREDSRGKGRQKEMAR